jgi:hypothetical protein
MVAASSVNQTYTRGDKISIILIPRAASISALRRLISCSCKADRLRTTT